MTKKRLKEKDKHHECIINDSDENNISDEEIIDEEAIKEIKDKKEKLIQNKNKFT